MSGPGGTPADRHWMEQALALAALGEGTTRPNPRVGCILVKEGRCVGQGFHRAAGEPHAEAIAVGRAGGAARGATAYVNLEPCAHVGRTPPCADLLVQAGVVRVVAASVDPNPLVNGRGLLRLREAGIRVDVGLHEAPARALNAPFLRSWERDRPWVTLKAAVSLDGRIAAARGRSRWITGEPARRFAHRLRLRHDAVLVGAGTVRLDDPVLTVRLPGNVIDPLRVVLAPTLDLPPRARLFEPPGGSDRRKVRLYVAAGIGDAAEAHFHERAEIRRVDARGGRFDLRGVLADLARDGVQSVLVEGGSRTLAGFLEEDLADAFAIFRAPLVLGAAGGQALFEMPAVHEPSSAKRFRIERRMPLGLDELIVGAVERTDRGFVEASCSPV